MQPFRRRASNPNHVPIPRAPNLNHVPIPGPGPGPTPPTLHAQHFFGPAGYYDFVEREDAVDLRCHAPRGNESSLDWRNKLAHAVLGGPNPSPDPNPIHDPSPDPDPDPSPGPSPGQAGSMEVPNPTPMEVPNPTPMEVPNPTPMEVLRVAAALRSQWDAHVQTSRVVRMAQVS